MGQIDTDQAIEALIQYALLKGLIEKEDKNWAINSILEVLQKPDFKLSGEQIRADHLEPILQVLIEDAIERGILHDSSITQKDLFDTAIMGRLTPKPSQVIRRFRDLYNDLPEKATDWFYQLAKDTNYIRTDRIEKDEKWTIPSQYGDIEISINLSKPEKDPKEIAAARNLEPSAYPACALCPENEGYAGRLNHPARQNLRMIPVQLDGEEWFLQYSPYVYYDEHCIILYEAHTPMVIDRKTLKKLLDFIGQFPRYFAGSNADLPIVGGSILSHEHFQGGRHTFAMEKAPIKVPLSFKGYEDIEAGIVKWPLSVLRLRTKDREKLLDLSERILQAWKNYDDPQAGILSHTDRPHNTITPIARMRDGRYELDLVLRNNRTSQEYPDGIFHPHPEIHNIKKENIGLIEVMGLAVLPSRLKSELQALAEYLQEGKSLKQDPVLEKHTEWVKQLERKYDFKNLPQKQILKILYHEAGNAFLTGLEHAGVFKDNENGEEAFLRFIETI